MLRHNAAALAGAGWSVPVVLAGNAAVRDEVAAVLRGRRTAGAPRPTTCCPTSAGWRPSRRGRRSATVFLEHVIGGDAAVDRPAAAAVGARGDPGRRPRGRRRRSPGCARTPRCPASSSLDVGGATTDVYCVPGADAEQATLGREAVGRAGPAAHRRGRPRASAASVARPAPRPPRPRDCRSGDGPARRWARRRRPWRCAGTCGPRRPTGRAAPARAASGSSSSPAGCSGTPTRPRWTPSSPGWPPTAGGAGRACWPAPRVVVDRRYVLAAAGLLAAEHPERRRRPGRPAGCCSAASGPARAARGGGPGVLHQASADAQVGGQALAPGDSWPRLIVQPASPPTPSSVPISAPRRSTSRQRLVGEHQRADRGARGARSRSCAPVRSSSPMRAAAQVTWSSAARAGRDSPA